MRRELKKKNSKENIIDFNVQKKRKKLEKLINSIVSDIKKGKPVIVVDSKERENEGK